MSWDIALAKNFKERDNKSVPGPVIGSVISVEPIKISILEDKAILTSEQIYLCSNLLNNRVINVSVNLATVTGDGTITYKDILRVGDKVLCVPTEDFQRFFIVDKVVI